MQKSGWMDEAALISAMRAKDCQQADAVADMLEALDRKCIVGGTITDTEGEFSADLQCKTEDGCMFTIKVDME